MLFYRLSAVNPNPELVITPAKLGQKETGAHSKSDIKEALRTEFSHTLLMPKAKSAQSNSPSPTPPHVTPHTEPKPKPSFKSMPRELVQSPVTPKASDLKLAKSEVQALNALKHAVGSKSLAIFNLLKKDIIQAVSEDNTLKMSALSAVIQQHFKEIEEIVIASVREKSPGTLSTFSPEERSAMIRDLAQVHVLKRVAKINNTALEKGAATTGAALNVVADIVGLIPMVGMAALPIKLVGNLIEHGVKLLGSTVVVVDEQGMKVQSLSFSSQLFQTAMEVGGAVLQAVPGLGIVASGVSLVGDMSKFADAAEDLSDSLRGFFETLEHKPLLA